MSEQMLLTEAEREALEYVIVHAEAYARNTLFMQHINTLRGLLASRKPREGWLPIDGAPMDGTGIWGGWFRGVFNDKQPWRHQGVTYWQDGEWMSPDDADSSYDEPTHWRPLPPAPADVPLPPSAGETSSAPGVCGMCGGTNRVVIGEIPE